MELIVLEQAGMSMHNCQSNNRGTFAKYLSSISATNNIDQYSQW